MARGHWLVKSEPGSYAWDDLVRDGRTRWDGVRNPEARNNLLAMRTGDPVLFYHSGAAREVVGVASVVAEAYRDPTADDERWVAVDLAPERPLARPVPLQAVKSSPALAKLPLVTRSRLSVMPLPKSAFDVIVRMGKA
jgi:predicted RNA-binding protein with PUA-like domain